MSQSKQTHRTATHWGAYDVDVEHGKVQALRPFDQDPDPSPIGAGMPQAIEDAVRISQPMVRKAWLDNGPLDHNGGRGNGPFVAVSWDRALDLAAGEIDRIRREHGNGAIYAGSYGWSSAGRFHHAVSQLHRFMSAAGGYVASRETYSLAAAEVILPHIVGMGAFEQMDTNTPMKMLAENTELFVCFGGIPLKNTQVEGGGMGRHHMPEALKLCAERGVKFVNISPIRSDLDDMVNAEWHHPRPNTDVAIMLGMAHVLYTEGLHDQAFLDKYCTGFDKFAPYLTGESDGKPKTPEWAAEISGMEADAIASLAREMAAKVTQLNLSWSCQRSDHGEQAFWMAMTLAAMLGQIGTPGGGVGFGYGAVNLIGRQRTIIAKPTFPLLPNEVRDFIPVARISDMLLNPGGAYQYDGMDRVYPDIRMVYWCGGNPFHHHQDINRLVRAWQKPETIIVHEPWWNANARHADIIFPAAIMLERNDIGVSRTDSYMFAMQKAIEPFGNSRPDYRTFSGLAGRLGCGEEFTEGRNEQEWIEHIYDRFRQAASESGIETPSFEEFWEAGHIRLPEPEPQPYMGAFRADPEGSPLHTPTGRIEIFSETVDSFGYDDCPGHPVWQEPVEWLGGALTGTYPLHLISNQPHTRLHSQFDNGGYSKGNKVKGREPMHISPEDAAARGIETGDIVRLYNDRGSCLAGAVVTDEIRAGVVRLPTGAWFDPVEPGVPGSLDVHGNPNVLTPDKGTSKLAQGPSAMSALVEVEKFEGDVPPIRAFTPPEIVQDSV